jgi:NADH-quinone oxidoreductase subunit N
MPVNFMPPSAAEMMRFLPEIILTIVATAVMVLESVSGDGDKTFLAGLSFAGLAAALCAALAAQMDPGFAFQNMMVVDGFATFFRVLVIAVGMLTVLCSTNYLRLEHHNCGEYYALVLFSVAGQSIMVSANELIMIFIGLEIASISSYILAGFLRDDKRNNESALKYFLLGSFATAFFLYGVAWIYGMTGVTNLTAIRDAIAKDPPPAMGVAAAAAMMLVGFAFKVSAVPFQSWAPDVYQGAPAPVSAFMSAGPKAAAFAIFLRVFNTSFGSVSDRWEPVVWVIALATMIAGNFAALSQTNIKRLLAYSSIAHAGYVLVAVTTHTEVATSAAMFYLASYAFMNIGAFAVVTHVARKGEKYVEIADFAGLGVRQPGTALLLTIFLMSLIGVPLTGGFFGKFYIFKAAIDAPMIWLSVLGLLNSAVAAYYYLRIIVVMYFHEQPADGGELLPIASGLRTALWISAAGTLFLGVFPSSLLEFAGRSASLLK